MKKILISALLVLASLNSYAGEISNSITNKDLQEATETALNVDPDNIIISNRKNLDHVVKFIAKIKGKDKQYHCYVTSGSKNAMSSAMCGGVSNPLTN